MFVIDASTGSEYDFFLFFSTSIITTYFTSLIYYIFIGFSLLIIILSIIKLPVRKVLEWLDSLPNPISAVVGVIGGITIIIKAVLKLF
jgi:hypothetical protein